MKRFKNILAVYNDVVGADDAVSQAAALASANRARLSIVDIFTPSSNLRAEIGERQKRLQRTVNALKYDGLDRVTAHVLTGDEADQIIRRVLSEQHDLVIASFEGGTSVMNTLYGNPATQLMRKCPCPVWVLKPGQSIPYRRILAAVDPDPADPTGDPMNIKIMDLATSLARTHHAELHVVHAWDVTGLDRDTLSSEITDTARKALLEKHQSIHRTSVDALIKRYRFPKGGPSVHLPRGLPEREITRVITEQGIDLTVMGMASRSGLFNFLIGNAAETILAGVRSGVLAVKPEGFQTSITQHEELAVA